MEAQQLHRVLAVLTCAIREMPAARKAVDDYLTAQEGVAQGRMLAVLADCRTVLNMDNGREAADALPT